jgi:beta-N-acetylhexosaminidase
MPEGLSRRAFLAAAAAGVAACVQRGGPDAPSPLDAELADDLGQTLWVGLPGPTLDATTRVRLERGAIGGVTLFARNVGAPAQLAALCDQLHEASARSTRVLVAVDQEGGRVQTVRGAATHWPPMARLAAHAELAAPVGRAIGDELAALGIDVDFAPVLDVRAAQVADDTIIGDRALAGDPATVARLGAALARGLADAGVLACAKHFPGHGGCADDSHLVLPVDPTPRAELLAGAVAPFAALATTVPLFMGAHVAYAGLGSDLPGTLDPRVATGLLRDELGFRGVLVSDNLEMGAVTSRFSIEDAAVRALTAGCDALLLCHRPDSYSRARVALWRAARASSTLRGRIAEASARVRTLKARHAQAGAQRPSLSVLGAPAHLELASALLENGILNHTYH